MTTDPTRVRFPFGLTLVAALVFVLLCGLGVWQVQRLQWKEGLIRQSEVAAALKPATLAEVLAAPDPAFRKVVIDCPGLASARYVELQTIHDGISGVRLLSLCRPLGSSEAFLIDRGFVAGEISARPPVSESVAPVRITAELRQTPPPGPMALPVDKGRFFARDSPAIARALGATTINPNTLFALTSSNPEWRALEPSAPPAAFANNHLGYALTWFGLALALSAFYIVLLRRRLNPPQPRSTGKEDDS